MRGVGGSKAEINEVHGLVAAPLERAQQSLDGSAQAAVEDFDRVEVCVGGPLPDRAGDRRSVTQKIEGAAFPGETDPARDGSHVNVTGADTAINDRDLYTATDWHWRIVMV